jgi:hypothetical protein
MSIMVKDAGYYSPNTLFNFVWQIRTLIVDMNVENSEITLNVDV